MTDKIHKIIPVGIKAENEIWLFASMLLLGIVRAMTFFIVYSTAYYSLFEARDGELYLIEGRYMKPFEEIINGCFDGFVIGCFVFFFLIIYHYGYHYKDSKSIYTMKRLPNKSELHIRCLSLPIIGIISSLLLSFLLLIIFNIYYNTKTPPQCILM